jgi:hypothetical protein
MLILILMKLLSYSIVVDEEFISYEENSIWPVTNGLQKISEPSIITVAA